MPIKTRLAHGGASMNWGSLSETSASDESTLLGDCTPNTLEAYVGYIPNPKKSEPRGKQPLAIDRITRCAKHHTDLFALMYGGEHEKERDLTHRIP